MGKIFYGPAGFGNFSRLNCGFNLVIICTYNETLKRTLLSSIYDISIFLLSAVGIYLSQESAQTVIQTGNLDPAKS